MHHNTKIQGINKKQGRSQPIAIAKGLRQGQLFYMVAWESLSDTMAYDRHQTEGKKWTTWTSEEGVPGRKGRKRNAISRYHFWNILEQQEA